jgi:hypothetical protein
MSDILCSEPLSNIQFHSKFAKSLANSIFHDKVVLSTQYFSPYVFNITSFSQIYVQPPLENDILTLFSILNTLSDDFYISYSLKMDGNDLLISKSIFDSNVCY